MMGIVIMNFYTSKWPLIQRYVQVRDDKCLLPHPLKKDLQEKRLHKGRLGNRYLTDIEELGGYSE